MQKNDYLNENGYLAESERIILRDLGKDECAKYWELDNGKEPLGEGKSFATIAAEAFKEAFPEYDSKELRELEERGEKSGRHIEKYKLYA